MIGKSSLALLLFCTSLAYGCSDRHQAPTPEDVEAISLELHQVVDGLDVPVGVASAGDGSGRLFILEKAGVIHIVNDGALIDKPFLDISEHVNALGTEQGLLGLAFHPDYSENGYFYVNYTDLMGDTIVSSFEVSADDSGQADAASEKLVLKQKQPHATHNGGQLVFGPDGYFYIALGDGGGDNPGNAQDGQTLLGSILRVDVTPGDSVPYSIPDDNPFVGQANFRDELWSIGLRNPWRFSFDRDTGEMYIADVGDSQNEEVNIQPTDSNGGANYGWPILEGSQCFVEENCAVSSWISYPQVEYGHRLGCAVTGGYVYRGSELPELEGVYLFGDFCSGSIWGLGVNDDGSREMVELLNADIAISSFGEDEAGELYVLNMAGGLLYEIGTQ